MSFTPKIDNTQLAHGGNRVYAVVVRHKVLKRVKDFFETNNIGNDGLLYKFTNSDYFNILYDEDLQQYLCSKSTMRRWIWEGRANKFKPSKKFQPSNTVLTEKEMKLCYDIVLKNKFCGKYEFQKLFFEATGYFFSLNYVSTIIKDLRLSKKVVTYEVKAKMLPNNLVWYYNWCCRYQNIDRNRLIFVDSCGFDGLNFQPKKGYAPMHERCQGEHLNAKGVRISCTGMMCYDPSRNPLFYQLTTANGSFETWIDCVQTAYNTQFILPNDILIVDNWSGFVGYDKGQMLAEILAELGIEVWPLPCYSPELNAIELLWHFVKQHIQHIYAGTQEERLQILHNIFGRVCDVSGYIKHVDEYIFNL